MWSPTARLHPRGCFYISPHPFTALQRILPSPLFPEKETEARAHAQAAGVHRRLQGPSLSAHPQCRRQGSRRRGGRGRDPKGGSGWTRSELEEMEPGEGMGQKPGWEGRAG